MSDNLQGAAIDAAGVVGSAQWALAMVARHGSRDLAAKAVKDLLLATAELQAALDEVKE